MRWLVGVDDSDLSRELLEFLTNKLLKPDDELIVVVVAEQVFIFAHEGWAAQRTLDIQKKKKETAHQVRQSLLTKGISCKVLLQRGHVGKSIVDEAHHRQVDLIVIGRRSLGTLDRKLAASTSSYVAHHAHCCVYVVKEECFQEPPDTPSEPLEEVLE